VLATPRRGGRVLPVWFRFEVFREWIDHALDETLRRKWRGENAVPVQFGEPSALVAVVLFQKSSQ
jgi:hypothetical protein